MLKSEKKYFLRSWKPQLSLSYSMSG